MGRGPSYPYVGLEDAIMLTRKMYDYTKRAPAPAESVVKDAWEYSPSSSSGQKVTAALKSYGLIEDASGGNGKALKLTQRAIRILLDEERSKERQEELQAAVISPKWYEFCWQTWGKEMPTSMRSNLLIEHGFVETTVDNFLRDYKESVTFAGLLNDDGFSKSSDGSVKSNDLLKIGDYAQWAPQDVLRMPEAERITALSDDGKFATVEGCANPVSVAEFIPGEPPIRPRQNMFIPATPRLGVSREVKVQIETFALPEGVTGQLQWPSEMSIEAYQDFEYQLEGLKKRVNRSVRKDVGTSTSVPLRSEG